MALEGLTEEELAKREADLIGAVEAAGGHIGNTSLMRELGWQEEDYWPIRNRLVDAGRLQRAMGRGGAVDLVPIATSTPPPAVVDKEKGGADKTEGETKAAPPTRPREEELYEPIATVLRNTWARDKRFRDIAVEITARQGKRDTGGRWTRPDITVASMTTLLFVPGKLFDVATFEVKPSDAIDVTAVYEALAHRRAATRSYVWLHIPEDLAGDAGMKETLEAVVSEAKRHGIGVIVGADPAQYDTWEEEVEAARVDPDPARLNDFISVQFGAGAKDEILKWMR